MPNVLILGGRAPVALDHARRFHHQGWQVHVADSVPCRLSGWSRAVRAMHRIAPPRYAPDRFAADLRGLIDSNAIDLVVPTCEEVFYLSRHRARLPLSVRVLADDFELLRRLHSKWHFLEAASGCGAKVPDSMLVHSIEEARTWAAGQPLVLKPEFSRFGVHVRLYPKGLPPDAPALEVAGAWVAQRHCAGLEYCSYSVADRGRVLAHALYQPRHRIGGSSSFHFQPAQLPRVRQFVERFAAKTGFTGQFSFDWIVGKDGEPSVLECNPRATSGVHLFAPCDAVPAALDGSASSCIEPGDVAPAMIASVMLSAGLFDAMRYGRAADWWRDYRAARDVICAPGDCWPLAGGLFDLASFARMAFKQRCNLREAATRDIEWNGESLSCA